MDVSSRKLAVKRSLLISMALFYSSFCFAAQPIDLNHLGLDSLQNLEFKETKRTIDFNKTLHIRVMQTYRGHSVWGGEFIVHVPNAEGVPLSKNIHQIIMQPGITMNGTLYQGLDKDLANAPDSIFDQGNVDRALSQAIATYEQKIGGKVKIKDKQSKIIIFIDQENKAHWAYQTSFYAGPIRNDHAPARPVRIIDAISQTVYMEWDDIKTIKPKKPKKDVSEEGGGFGGNLKMGKLIYDGMQGNLAKLTIDRKASKNKCYLYNTEVTVRDYNSDKFMSFSCTAKDDQHGVYWSGDFDAVNDGYSPGNDALFNGQVIQRMYQEWYGIPVLTNDDGSAMVLDMVVHKRYFDNAYWDGSKMTFGDGYSIFYPLTSLGVTAHEISHGFTEQHSNLTYTGQSGGMNESFSDMAAQAAEFYAYGKNTWQIGAEIFKAENEALRYMDKPSKDCHGRKPGNDCSIDDASQYRSNLNVHYSSGVYNHFFYVLGTSAGWDPKRAFDVMVHANSNYWTANATFVKAACGVINAAKDLGYDVTAIKTAFDVVKINYSNC
jgi:pseudolysin